MIGIDQVESPSAKALGRWQLIAVEHTAVFSDGLDPEPSRVRTIRMFDPDYVPILVRRTFQAPTGGEVTMGYHVIARHIRTLDEGDTRKPIQLASVPALWPYPSGSIYAQRTWSLAWKEGSLQYLNGFPDIYLPHDDWLVKWMRAKYHQMHEDADGVKRAMIRQFKADVEAEQKELEEIEANHRLKLKDDRKEVRDAIANEIHWLEHPDQRPAPPEPKGFTEVHMEETP